MDPKYVGVMVKRWQDFMGASVHEVACFGHGYAKWLPNAVSLAHQRRAGAGLSHERFWSTPGSTS